MSAIRVENRTRGTVLGGRIRLADDPLSRLRGFLFRREPVDGEGILLSPCNAVHMFGMRFPLDVIFIADDGLVVGTYAGLRPWKWTSVHPRAVHALEVPVGTIQRSDTRPGDSLSWAAVTEHDEPDEADRPRRPDTPVDMQIVDGSAA